MKNRLRLALLAGACSLALCAQTPNSPSSPQSSPGAPGSGRSDGSLQRLDRESQRTDVGADQMAKSGDTAFAIKAAQGGIAEVKMGQLATEKASDPDVKAFGQQMVDDHTKANEQLKAIAKDKNMTLPTDVDARQKAKYDKMSQMSGADFDKAYVRDMLKDHQEDVKDFTKEANKGKDDKLKSFASDTLPTLQSHLDKIKGISGKMGGGSGKTAGTR